MSLGPQGLLFLLILGVSWLCSVSSWLTGQGMTITARTPHYIGVRATVAQVDAAFDTQVSEFVTVVIDPKLGPRT